MFEFDEQLHRGGEAMVGRIDAMLVQATAWWIAAELVRRHPGEMTVIETHPGGGMYDCLNVYRTSPSEPELVVHMNHVGSITHGSWFGGESSQERFSWPEVILSPGRRKYVIEQLERVERIRSPRKTPPTDSFSIGPRVIAGFLSRTALGLGGWPALAERASGLPWRALNGVQDTEGYGGGRRDELFAVFSDADRQSRSLNPTDAFSDPAYRFWFIADRHEEPQVAIDIRNGLAWSGDLSFDLMQEYEKADRRLDPVINYIFPTMQ